MLELPHSSVMQRSERARGGGQNKTSSEMKGSTESNARQPKDACGSGGNQYRVLTEEQGRYQCFVEAIDRGMFSISLL